MLLLELGGTQAEVLRDDLVRCGFSEMTLVHDEEGDVRGIEAALSGKQAVWPGN